MVGGYDEEFNLSYSDIDICLRLLKKGYRIVYYPFSIIYHYESATRADSNPPKNICRAFTQFREQLFAGDPFFRDQISDAFNPKLRLFELQRKKVIESCVNSSLKNFNQYWTKRFVLVISKGSKKMMKSDGQ
jgi:hypothetical protein